MKKLFVCSANICRSALAEVILRKKLMPVNLGTQTLQHIEEGCGILAWKLSKMLRDGEIIF